MTEVVSRRKIMRACKSRGWMVQPAALKAMHQHLNLLDKDYTEDILEDLARHVEKNTKLITEAIWEKAMESTEDTVMIKEDGGLEIIDAFETPRLVYDSMRKTFRVEEKEWPLLGDTADKINLMAQRYDLVHQRMLRHEVFRKRNSSHPEKDHQKCTLTPIESLLGKQNSAHSTVLVLGILVQVEEGQYYLEDPSGRVQVSFCNAVAADSFFVLENSILLVEATFQDEILFIERVGPPFIEQRQKSLQMLQQQVRHNHFLPSEQFADDHSSCVVLSDAHLDQPRVLNFLEGLFQSYATDFDPSDLPLFCLMGNFTSNPQIPAYQAWEELAILIAKYPFLAQHAQFVFIPGPRDTKSAILPQTSILESTLGLKRLMQSYQIENIHWASNPCRIRQNGKEIVLFRHDILSWMLQNQVRLPLMDGTEDRTPHSKMVKTILDQGHLMPVARAPIYWNYDHAMRLYPLPDAFILGCSSAMEDYEIYEGCDAIKPGSFAKNGKYATFSFADNDAMDTCTSDGEESVMNTRVDFCQVKEPEN